MANPNLDAAHAYAAMGWKVFPLRSRTKVPLTEHGFHDATDDPDQVTRWWTNVAPAGVGIATGSPSSLIVLDVDPRNGGNESLATRLAQHGDLPPTVEALTGGGGRHLLFAIPEGTIVPSSKP